MAGEAVKSRYLPPRVVDGVVAYVSAAADIPVSEIRSESRCRGPSRARQQVMWWLCKQGYSFPQVGRAFNRDHTTAIYAMRAVDDRIAAGGGVTIHRIGKGVHSRSTGSRANIRPMKKAPRPIPQRLPRPKFSIVQARVEEAAEIHGLPVGVLLGGSLRPTIVAARKYAWRALLSDGYSITGIAKAWGCGRKSLQRVRDEMAFGMKAAAE